MRLRTLLIGFVALVFGISAASGVYLVNSTPKASGQEMAMLAVVSRDVPRGTNLTEEMVHLRPWPKEFLPVGAITQVQEALGRTVWIPLVKDEPILEGKLAAKGTGRGMASLIPRGMRAVTIQTPNVSTGVAGFILPGNKVDVLVTLSQLGHGDAAGGSGTLTLLQNVEILAVDQRIEAPSENVIDPKELRSVTLLVSPEDAVRLDLGQNKGTLSLSLRNPGDSATDSISQATLAGLRGVHMTQSLQDAVPPEETDGLLEEFPVEAETPTFSEPAASSTGGMRLTRIRTLRGISGDAVYIRHGSGSRKLATTVERSTVDSPEIANNN